MDHIALDKISENEFVSQVNPGWMGNLAMIAYGAFIARYCYNKFQHQLYEKGHRVTLDGSFQGIAPG